MDIFELAKARILAGKGGTGGGGGGGGSSASKKEVNFYDYDGTLLHSYTVAEAQALSELPPLPTQKGLVCQGWNWTLEDIKAHNRAVDVGATYITDDGKTRLYIKIAAEGRMDVPLYFTQTVANGVTINWGDGSATETLSGTGKVNTVHTYASIGEYVITLDVVDGCTLGLGYTNSSYCVLGSSSYQRVYSSMLKKVELGNGVKSINIGAFEYCYSLVSINVPDGVTNISDNAFGQCYSLASIVIPNSVKSIGHNAFSNCFSLSCASIPDGVTSTSSNVFPYCHSLASINIPDSVTSIGSSAFNECYSLKSINIPDSVTSIGSSAFNGCSSLASINIPDSVTSIGSSAFNGCKLLATITIPDSVISISDKTFYNCQSLASIVIPDGVTNIGESAFTQCYSLASINIPDGVTSIGNSAFYYCYSLASIVIPNSVKRIGSYVFNACYGMKIYDFTSHTSVPTLANTNAFQYISSDCEIRVPAALYDEWIAATNWSSFASKIVAK